MPDRCVVYGCSNVPSTEKGIAVFRIPFAKTSSEEGRRRRKLWLDFVMKTRKNFNPSSSSAICSDHFTPDSFQRRIFMPGQERRLIRDDVGISAIPTVYTILPEKELSSRDRRSVSPFRLNILTVIPRDINHPLTYYYHADCPTISGFEKSCCSSIHRTLQLN